MFSRRVDDEIRLRVLELRDVDALYRLTDACRRHLREWLPWVDGVRAPEATRAFVQASLEQYARNDGFQAGIWAGGELAGVVGLHGIRWGNRFTALGYWLGESFEGRGIMTRSCRAVVGACFTELELHRVEIRCAVGNRRSRAVAERLGFREEGRLRDAEWLYDRYVDHVLYALLSGEWRGKSGETAAPRPTA